MSKYTVPVLDSTLYTLGSLPVHGFFYGIESVSTKLETVAQ